MIEKVFEKEGYPLDAIAGQQIERTAEALQFRTNALLKVHGDLADPASQVLTKTSYDRAYKSWLQVLANLASTAFLFLGCSLTTDRTLRVLEERVRRAHGRIRHYAQNGQLVDSSIVQIALPRTPAKVVAHSAPQWTVYWFRVSAQSKRMSTLGWSKAVTGAPAPQIHLVQLAGCPPDRRPQARSSLIVGQLPW